MKIYFPIVDTDRLKFEYKGRKISMEEYQQMVYEFVEKHSKSIDWYLRSNRFTRHGNIIDIDYEDKKKHPEFSFKLIECEADMYDSRMNETDEKYFKVKEMKGEMFIFGMNILPITITDDIESELKFWKTDSSNLLKDKMLDDETKLKNLPTRDIYVEIEGHAKRLKRCKIIEIYTSKKTPFKVGIIAEKIMN